MPHNLYRNLSEDVQISLNPSIIAPLRALLSSSFLTLTDNFLSLFLFSVSCSVHYLRSSVGSYTTSLFKTRPRRQKEKKTNDKLHAPYLAYYASGISDGGQLSLRFFLHSAPMRALYINVRTEQWYAALKMFKPRPLTRSIYLLVCVRKQLRKYTSSWVGSCCHLS